MRILISFLLAIASALVGFSLASDECRAECRTEKALLGDKDAAEYLAEDNFNIPNARRYWTLISAENGSVLEQYNLGIEYIEAPHNKFEPIRGRYWMCKSASSGHVAAKKYVSERKILCAAATHNP